jgi:excisionase family DNA binding protein
MDSNQKLALSITETATVLGLSRPSVYRLLRSEGFPTVRVGRRVLVSRAGLERWLVQQTEREVEE